MGKSEPKSISKNTRGEIPLFNRREKKRRRKGVQAFLTTYKNGASEKTRAQRDPQGYEGRVAGSR